MEEEAVEVVGLAVGLVEVRDFDGVVDLKGVKELSKVYYIYIYIYIYIFCIRCVCMWLCVCVSLCVCIMCTGLGI